MTNITETEEHIYRKVEIERLKETAKEQWNDRYGDEEPIPSEIDLTKMANIFQLNHVSDVANDTQWNDIIKEYHDALVINAQKKQDDVSIPWSKIEEVLNTEFKNIERMQPEPEENETTLQIKQSHFKAELRAIKQLLLWEVLQTQTKPNCVQSNNCYTIKHTI